MTRINPTLEAFNSGELSPRLAARLTFDRYPFGCALLENLLPLIEGGAMRAPGSRYAAAVNDETALARMIPFVFSTVQAYILEFGASTIRVFRNQGQITVADTNAVITNGTFTDNINDWDDRSTGAASISHDATNGMLQLVGAASETAWAEQDVAVSTANKDNEHVLKFRVLGVASDTIEFRVGTTSTGNEVVDDVELRVGYHCYAFTPTATTFYIQFRNTRAKTVKIDDVSLIDNAPVEIDSPYAAADLRKIRYAQSADVQFLTTDGYAWRKLSRRGHTTWSLAEVDNLDGPYLDTNTTATTLDPSATTGLGITITASAVTGINDNTGFATTDVGRLVRIEYGSAWGYARITAHTSTTEVTADVLRDFTGGHAAEATWRLGAWSDTTGHPKTIGFFEQRALLAATTDNPKTFWASQSLADYENFQPDDGSGTVEDDDAFGFTLGSGAVDAIQWVIGGRRLFIGTSSGEWLITSDGPILKPSDVEAVIHTTHGSSDVAPVRIGHAILFLQKGKRKIRELVFDFDIDGLRAPDMTALASHILKGGALEMAYQQEPSSIVWCVRNDGQLCAMTYERSDPQKNVVGWGRRILGGSFASGDAIVESVATIPGTNGSGQTEDSTDRNEVWIVVKRTINGSTRRYVEFFEGEFEGPRREDYDSTSAWQTAVISAQEDAYFADSILTYSGALTTTITGLDHLEGETVTILGSGAVQATKVVSSGQIELDTRAGPVQVGLAYKHKYKSLRPVQAAKMGSPIGQTQRILGVGYVLLDTGILRIGPDADNLELVPFRKAAYAMDRPVPLFTGEGYAQFDGDSEPDPRIVIEDDAPLPFTLLALAPRMEIAER